MRESRYVRTLNGRLSHRFFDFLIMSTLQNEILLENIYEELMAELIDTETLAKYTEEMINSEVIRRFWDYTN